jgi:hypothetical protein
MNAQNDRRAVEFVKITRREMQEVVGGASVDYFLILDGVKGESTRAGTHGAGGGGGAGKVHFQDMHFTARV